MTNPYPVRAGKLIQDLQEARYTDLINNSAGVESVDAISDYDFGSSDTFAGQGFTISATVGSTNLKAAGTVYLSYISGDEDAFYVLGFGNLEGSSSAAGNRLNDGNEFIIGGIPDKSLASQTLALNALALDDGVEKTTVVGLYDAPSFAADRQLLASWSLTKTYVAAP